ncbi:nitroreductase/quinone reductase family protein [[Kitasatospora] papulosa]|uniref:nitroreductase/quinone reductase family protein n=1 Tax=[Kitasatospora] papulosa TaxID=1464011 RepID=UPI0038230260
MPLTGEYEPSTLPFARDQVKLYERTGGVEGGTFIDTGLPVIILTSVGAKSGKLRKTSRLEHQLGSALPSLNNSERIQVLVQVDRSTADNQPLLSSLLAAGDPHFAYQHYRHALTALGLHAPADDEDLRDVIEADAEQVFTDRRPR